MMVVRSVAVAASVLVAGTAAVQGQCPGAPTGLAVVPGGANNCDQVLTWNFTGGPVFGFRVYRGSTPDFASASVLTIALGNNARSITDINPPATANWRYWVQPVGYLGGGCPSGEGAVSAPVRATTLGLAPPANIRVQNTSCRSVYITWDYDPGMSVRTIFDTPGGPVLHTSTDSSGSYWSGSTGQPVPTRARVARIGPCGPGPETAITLSIPDSPYPPLAVSASDDQSCGVVVTWTPDPRHRGGYRIERETIGFGSSYVGDVAAGEDRFVDTNGVIGTTYTYRVKGSNECGDSAGYTYDTGESQPVQALSPTRSARATIGGTAVLATPNISAAGTVATFAWRKGVNPDGSGGTVLVDGLRISGATTGTLTIAGVLASDEDLYALTISNPCGVQTFVSSVILQGGGNACRADFDDSGTLSTQDIFAFLNAWFAGCP